MVITFRSSPSLTNEHGEGAAAGVDAMSGDATRRGAGVLLDAPKGGERLGLGSFLAGMS